MPEIPLSDLKTGYIVGATPWRQQIGELIGVVASAVAIGAILYLLNAAWGYGSTELPAPQATLMKMIVEGVMGGNLPWTLVFAGAFIGIVVEVLGIPVLPFAVGLYLPIHLSTPMMIGGLVRLFLEKKKGMDEKAKKDMIDNGVLYCSGLIAGEWPGRNPAGSICYYPHGRWLSGRFPGHHHIRYTDQQQHRRPGILCPADRDPVQDHHWQKEEINEEKKELSGFCAGLRAGLQLEAE